MYHHTHTQHPASQPQPRLTNRVPQFNKDYCGYHCGEGCEPYDTGDVGSDTSSTVFSENGAQDIVHSSPTHGPSEASLLPLSYTMNETIEPETGHLHGNDSANTRDASFSSPELTQYYSDPLDSPRNLIPSSRRSARSPDNRSVGTASPSVWIEGVGAWMPTEDSLRDLDRRRVQFPLEYYFLETPLRLSPLDELGGDRAESP